MTNIIGFATYNKIDVHEKCCKMLDWIYKYRKDETKRHIKYNLHNAKMWCGLLIKCFPFLKNFIVKRLPNKLSARTAYLNSDFPCIFAMDFWKLENECKNLKKAAESSKIENMLVNLELAAKIGL